MSVSISMSEGIDNIEKALRLLDFLKQLELMHPSFIGQVSKVSEENDCLTIEVTVRKLMQDVVSDIFEIWYGGFAGISLVIKNDGDVITSANTLRVLHD